MRLEHVRKPHAQYLTPVVFTSVNDQDSASANLSALSISFSDTEHLKLPTALLSFVCCGSLAVCVILIAGYGVKVC